MGVPDDANPLNRRLPAEVITRQRQAPKAKAPEEPPLNVDRTQVLAMKPEQRFKWLSKALTRCQEGKVQASILYDIMSNAKFTADCSDKIGAKMFRAVRGNLELFSSKQRRFLESEGSMVKMFRATLTKGGNVDEATGSTDRAARSEDAGEKEADEEAPGNDDDEAAHADAPAALETDIAALWARITTLSAVDREAAVGALDAATKERLEDFLEARITKAKVGTDSGASPASPAPKAAVPAPRAKEVEAAAPAVNASRSRSRARCSESPVARVKAAKEKKAGKKREASPEAKKPKKEKSDKKTKDTKETKETKEKDRDRSRRGRRGKTGKRGRSSSDSRASARRSERSDSSPRRSRSRRRRG